MDLVLHANNAVLRIIASIGRKKQKDLLNVNANIIRCG